jgi:predicted nucleic acid-binding protein
MRLVIDANILVGQLTRDQGRRLLRHPNLQLLITEQAWSEAWHEFPKRLQRRVAAGTFSAESVASALAVARQIADAYITSFPPAIYASNEAEARLRIPDDPDDWQTVALALATGADIWTEDKDFFGCGVATWRMPQLRAILDREPDAVAK